MRFTRISREKIEAGKFYDPQKRELIKEPMCDDVQSEAKISAWKSLKSSYKHSGKLKSYCRLSANSGYECQSNCIFCGHASTVFQRTVKNCMKSSVNVSPSHPHYGRVQLKQAECKLSHKFWYLKQNAVAAKHRVEYMKRPLIYE